MDRFGIDIPSAMYDISFTAVEKQDDYSNIAPLLSQFYSDSNPAGMATVNLNQMIESPYNDNVKLILQTGGAKRWQNPSINPNRAQRLLIGSEGCFYLDDTRPVNMGAPDSLADFLKYCRKNYPADHEVVILWNHGGGFRGYGCDEIFDDMLSLKELREAFTEAVGQPDKNSPPFEAIGFDACLMGSAEVVHGLSGFARYFYASEETEPGGGWDYGSLFEAVYETPSLNGAALGKIITDTYMKACCSFSAEIGNIADVTFSVYDLSKADDVYDAYAAFAKKALIETAKDPSVMADISRAANASHHYAGSSSDYYNTIDLGSFMNGLPKMFSAEAKAVTDAVNNCLVYMRNTRYTEDSTGITVYYPDNVSDLDSLMVFLEYICDASDNTDINTLYYYKVAGCINEEQKKYLEENNYPVPSAIDYRDMEGGVFWSPLSVDGSGGMTLSLDSSLLPITQGASFMLGLYDEENECITSYGESDDLTFAADGTITSNFNGRWLSYGGVPLETAIISRSDNYVKYKAKVIYNGMTGYMIIEFDRNTGEASLLGISRASDNIVLDKNMFTPKKGDTVEIIKTAYDESSTYVEVSEKVTVKNNTALEMRTLRDGTYIEYIIVSDLRSDEYPSDGVIFNMNGGVISGQMTYTDYLQDY